MKKVLIRVYTDGYVYCLHDAHNSICRIGKTDKKAIRRIQGQVGYYPFELLVSKAEVKNITECERLLHTIFKPLKLRGDWYKITPVDFLREVKKYKKGRSKDVNYVLTEDWDTSLNSSINRTTKRRLMHKKDQLI